MSEERTWHEPQPNWLPLRQAVFTFCVAADSKKTFDRTLKDLTETEIVEIAATNLFSLQELSNILAIKSGATSAHIDLGASNFSFLFENDGFVGGPFWSWLEEPREAPLNEAQPNASFGRWTARDDEEEARYADHLKGIREATALVLNQFLLRGLDRAVSTRAVVLYGRMVTTTARFVPLATDLWPLLNVIDWEHGVAVTPDGVRVWSIHAARLPGEVVLPSGRGRGPKPIVLEQVKDTMRREILDGQRTVIELQAMLEKTLAETYHVSRDTARKARNAVVAEFGQNSNRDK